MPPLKATWSGKRMRSFWTILAMRLQQTTRETNTMPSGHRPWTQRRRGTDPCRSTPCSRLKIDLQPFESATKGESILTRRLAVLEMAPIRSASWEAGGTDCDVGRSEITWRVRLGKEVDAKGRGGPSYMTMSRGSPPPSLSWPVVWLWLRRGRSSCAELALNANY